MNSWGTYSCPNIFHRHKTYLLASHYNLEVKSLRSTSHSAKRGLFCFNELRKSQCSCESYELMRNVHRVWSQQTESWCTFCAFKVPGDCWLWERYEFLKKLHRLRGSNQIWEFRGKQKSLCKYKTFLQQLFHGFEFFGVKLLGDILWILPHSVWISSRECILSRSC